MLLYNFLKLYDCIIEILKKYTLLKYKLKEASILCWGTNPIINALNQFRFWQLIIKMTVISNTVLSINCRKIKMTVISNTVLSLIAGPAEVDILDSKLKEAKMGDKDFRLFYSSLFPSPPPKYHDQFTDLLTDISGWPTVSPGSLIFSSWIIYFSSKDETEYLLMTLILLFSPNSLPQAEFGLVERFQQEYFTLLQKYLDKKYGYWLLCVLYKQ